MQNAYTIGRLARIAGVPVSTIRYYEQRGLLQPERRTDANYRIYGPASLRQLRFIRVAQETGFTLEDIAVLLGLRTGVDRDCCKDVERIVERRLDRITEQLAELKRVQGVLNATLDWCRNPPIEGRCAVLDDLDVRASSEDSAG